MNKNPKKQLTEQAGDGECGSGTLWQGISRFVVEDP